MFTQNTYGVCWQNVGNYSSVRKNLQLVFKTLVWFGLVWFGLLRGSCQCSKFIHKQLDRKGFFSILLRSQCTTGSPQLWLDASLQLGAPLSWEMSLIQNPVAVLTRTLFLASLSHQRSLVTSKLDLKRARHLSNF